MGGIAQPRSGVCKNALTRVCNLWIYGASSRMPGLLKLSQVYVIALIEFDQPLQRFIAAALTRGSPSAGAAPFMG